MKQIFTFLTTKKTLNSLYLYCTCSQFTSWNKYHLFHLPFIWLKRLVCRRIKRFATIIQLYHGKQSTLRVISCFFRTCSSDNILQTQLATNLRISSSQLAEELCRKSYYFLIIIWLFGLVFYALFQLYNSVS